MTCGHRPYVLHCSHLTVWSQLVPKLHCGGTSCVCLYLCSFLSERDIITTTFRPLRYNVHSVGVNIYIQWSKSWSLSSTDHEYARRFVGIHNKRVDGSQGTTSLADTDTELQMFSWTNERSRLGNWNLCGKTEKSSFNLRKSSGSETFFVLFSEQLETWTLESKNNRYHKCKGLQYWCNWQILFIYVSTLLAEQQRRGAVGALLLSGWASSAIYKSCSDCCQRDVKSSSRPVLHTPCEDQG